MKIELDGIDPLSAHLQQMTLRVPNASMSAVRDSAYHLLGEAVPRAPIDTGDLRGTADVQPVENGYEVRFFMPYAATQHEVLWFNHPRGGGPKYLEGPLLENRDRYLAHIASEAGSAMRGSTGSSMLRSSLPMSGGLMSTIG